MSMDAALRTRVVGELACQRDSYLRTLDTVVVSCVEAPPQKPNDTTSVIKDKKTKNTMTSNDEITESPRMWEIEFADSVLFPEGGGQPTDHGTIITTSSDSSTQTIPITSIQRQGLRCLHLSPDPLPLGTHVRQEVKFTRRWDHMQQHTGQHLLSAIMDTYDNLETLGWGMGIEGEMSYVELPRKPSQDEIQEIQDKCNEIIRDNIKITVETPFDAKAHTLPEDYDKERGIVRVIKIGDIDCNPCCGTHLSQTSHVSLLLLHHTQSIRSTNCRLFFTAGDRAIKLATSSIRCQRSIATTLSSGSSPTEILDKVEKLNQNVVELKRKEKRLLMEIAKFEADRVKVNLQATGKAWVYRADEGLEYINWVVHEIKDIITGFGVVLFASGEGKKGGHVFIIGNEKSVEAVVVKVKEILKGVKGGGKGGKWQGKVMEWGKKDLESLKDIVEE